MDAPTGAATQIHGVAGVCARAIELHAAYPTLYTRTRSTAREKGLLQHGSESETPRWFHTPLFSTVPVVECTGIYTYLCCGPVICSSTKTTAGEKPFESIPLSSTHKCTCLRSSYLPLTARHPSRFHITTAPRRGLGFGRQQAHKFNPSGESLTIQTRCLLPKIGALSPQ